MPLHAARLAKALRRGRLSDSFSNSLASFSPYRGCAHACAYCDGRAERYYVEGDFGSDVAYRENLIELLERELPLFRERDSKGRRPLLCIGSGVTDAYQPAEARLGLTRRAAELLLKERRPALVMTKSALALRDLDLWSRLNIEAGFVFVMSIAGVDESVREAFEPGASPYAERFAAIKAFSEAGCPTGVLAMPLLPGIADDEPTIRAIFAAAKEAGADFVFPGGLTLRPGRQKDHFMARLKDARPDLVELYLRAYREERPSGAPAFGTTKPLEAAARSAARLSAMPARLPHARLRRIVPEYEALHILFGQMRELYGEAGVDTRALKDSSGRYASWLDGQRLEFNRRRTLPGDWIEREFLALIGGTGFDDLLGNERLSSFARRIVEGGAEFDYAKLNVGRA